ncbi:MAG: bifunctional 4-hydroxy-2-oxoglutarate aldolase/2-dehydro-3-deoxy-phosphogluconate aldolase [Deltaproteobacteria bacterium]|nr:bifunctional 4-hydroxy-2-oxoglutarate aldolase/2-dehydro-3-deoxy-phosphogluconate aldolase [Deltaproteobacteria bacterium]MBW2305889.1 bifunctional 4-hydroxy-2-oxoglutarate aldolase/2-dehydro-3-deoxy-phosphogluconate aldolase [Deltaproteobacteria bacterium]
MATHTRLEVLTAMFDIGFIPLFHHPDPQVAIKVIQACAAGGAKVVEFTNRGDFAIDVFKAAKQHFLRVDPSIILGAGSVNDPAAASLFIMYGADFIVSQVLCPDVARVCNRRKIPYSPGCSTLTELQTAEELGCELPKIFPGDLLKPSFVKAIKGPSPWTTVLVTGGVEPTKESITAWIKAGASVLGMGSKLISKEIIEKKDYPAITQTVRQVIQHIQEARGQ